MPEDVVPISTTVPETVTMDLGADKEQIKSLESEFTDFWSEQDSKDDLSKEPTPSPPAKEPPPAPSLETTKTIAEEPSQSPIQADIDKMELSAGEFKPSQEHVEQFKKIKELWKTDRHRADEAAKKLSTIEAELAEARKNAWTPETRADYEHASQIRRRFDFMSDPDFLKKFQEPVRKQFDKILDESINVLADRNAAIKWVNDLKRDNYGPDSVTRDWWLNSVVARVPNDLNRQALLNSVTKLLDLQQERDSEIYRNTNDKSAFDNWVNEKTSLTHKHVTEELMAEIGVQEQRIKDFLPVDVSKAKTVDERAAMEAHNERFKQLNDFLVSQIKDISENGPRAWVRVAMEATRSQLMNNQIINLEKEIKELIRDRDKYKSDLEKITGARRRLAQTTGSQPSSEPKKNGQGLSLKDLSDPRKAMNDFWEEVDRKAQ